MKLKYLNFLTWGALCLLLSCKKEKPKDVPKDEIETLLSQMTLEEKVGQMTNLTLSTVATETDSTITLDTAKLKDVIVSHHVGSLQNVIGRAYDLKDWHLMVGAMQKLTLENTKLKIPFLYCIDAVHGANYINGGTQFPHNIALAATFNPDLVSSCASITAAETRAAGIRYNFSPVLDAGRNQQWSRLPETFGEDVYTVKEMGIAAIKGFEGTDVSKPDKVASCMKHYIGYGVPNNGKDRAPAYIPEVMLREYFLPPFKAAVDQGAHTLMVNSGELNGVPLHVNKYLLTDVLRDELGFKGVVISDWQDILKLHERHRVAASHKDAVQMTINAGIDMCIVPFDFTFYDDLIQLVKEGKISETRIDESVRRILKLKQDLGLFKESGIEKAAMANFAKPEYAGVAYQAAAEALTLLKNEKEILPLKEGQRVLVTGPSSQLLSALHGAWSYSWQGDKEHLYPDSLLTIAEAFAGDANVRCIPSGDFKGNAFDKAKILREVLASEVIVLCMGEAPYAETPGNIPDLALDAAQQELFSLIAKTGKPIVLVLVEGRPRIVREIEPHCSAIVQAYWPCSQGARAIHDVLVGKVNPSGKLPYTYPRYSGTLNTYDHKTLDEAIEVAEPYSYNYVFDPQFEFGHGLSYTQFKYSDLSLSRDTIQNGDTLTISVNISNVGKRAGMETAMLFSKDLYASITPSVKRLRRFQKISLQPGEQKTVKFTITKEDLAFVNQELKTVTEDGAFEMMIKDLHKKFWVR